MSSAAGPAFMMGGSSETDSEVSSLYTVKGSQAAHLTHLTPDPTMGKRKAVGSDKDVFADYSTANVLGANTCESRIEERDVTSGSTFTEKEKEKAEEEVLSAVEKEVALQEERSPRTSMISRTKNLKRFSSAEKERIVEKAFKKDDAPLERDSADDRIQLAKMARS